jgi:hypothetical protein
LGQFAELPFVLAVTASLPVKNVKELIDLAKGGIPAEFAQLIATDRKRYARIIIDNKLTAN